MPKKIKLNGPVIGDGSSWLYDWFGMPYISAGRLSKELDDARGEEVELYINSPGGSVFAGSEVYTILKEYAGNVTAKVTGVAASAASFFLMAANKIMMSPTSQLMIHNARTGTEGDKNIHASNTDMLRGTDVAITNAYRLRTGKTTEELLDLMNKTSWMNAQQAIELGFADGILFDEDNTLMAVSNSIFGEIPPQIEEKLRDVMINAALKGGKVEGLDLSSLSSLGGIQRVLNSIGTENQTEEVDKTMDLEELKAKHPETYLVAVKAGADQERQRIKDIDDIAATVADDLVVKAKYETPITAGELALQALKADAGKGIKHLENRQQELANSTAVNSQTPPNADEAKKQEEAKNIDMIAAAANAGRGTEAK